MVQTVVHCFGLFVWNAWTKQPRTGLLDQGKENGRTSSLSSKAHAAPDFAGRAMHLQDCVERTLPDLLGLVLLLNSVRQAVEMEVLLWYRYQLVGFGVSIAWHR